jgi:hypothetical protein
MKEKSQKELNIKLKKIVSIVLLITFLPIAIYSLGTGKLTLFFFSALITFILMKISDKFLKI